MKQSIGDGNPCKIFSRKAEGKIMLVRRNEYGDFKECIELTAFKNCLMYVTASLSDVRRAKWYMNFVNRRGC
jgi:hypothetical protein